MTEQRQRAKADAKSQEGRRTPTLSVYRATCDAHGATEFTGYQELDDRGARCVGLVVDGEAGRRRSSRASTVEVVLDRTPFYAESGGQIADEGVITGRRRASSRSLDVQRPVKGLVVHTVEVLERRRCAPGAHVHAEVDPEWRVSALPGALRHPRRARGAAPGARPDGAAVRLVQQARLPAARLRLGPGAVAGDPQRDRGGRQPRGPRRTCRCRRSYMPLPRGPRDRRAGAVRRDVRRGRARRRDRRPVVARAVRWHPRRSTRARSARSPSPASRRSAPACAASRRSSASRRCATWPGSGRSWPS